jgi:hypothetical protein
MTTWAEIRDAQLLADARLVILKELNHYPDGQANETLIDAALKTFGHRHMRDWVRERLAEMERLGAVKVSVMNEEGFMVAAITKLGVGHLERLTIIDGISAPSKGV